MGRYLELARRIRKDTLAEEPTTPEDRSASDTEPTRAAHRPNTASAKVGATLPAPPFAAANVAVRIRSDVLGGEEIWLASNAEVSERLTAEGLSPVFLSEEIPLLQKFGPDELRRICEIKRVFTAARVEEQTALEPQK